MNQDTDLTIHLEELGSRNLHNIHVGSRTYLDPHTVVMIRADISYSHIFMSDGHIMLVSTHLLRLQQRFGKHLLRIHRSFLINPDFFKSLHNMELSTTTGLHCPVSRRMRKNLIAQNLISA